MARRRIRTSRRRARCGWCGVGDPVRGGDDRARRRGGRARGVRGVGRRERKREAKVVVERRARRRRRRVVRVHHLAANADRARVRARRGMDRVRVRVHAIAGVPRRFRDDAVRRDDDAKTSGLDSAPRLRFARGRNFASRLPRERPPGAAGCCGSRGRTSRRRRGGGRRRARWAARRRRRSRRRVRRSSRAKFRRGNFPATARRRRPSRSSRATAAAGGRNGGTPSPPSRVRSRRRRPTRCGSSTSRPPSAEAPGCDRREDRRGGVRPCECARGTADGRSPRAIAARGVVSAPSPSPRGGPRRRRWSASRRRGVERRASWRLSSPPIGERTPLRVAGGGERAYFRYVRF